MASPIVGGEKKRVDYLREAKTQELLDELARRRKEALSFCSEEEIQVELEGRPGYDGPPKYVEK